MGKQTMGVPLHALTHRSDNKLYHLQTAQSPIVRPYLHDELDMDNYPLGTNAVVAVLSYTVSFKSSFSATRVLSFVSSGVARLLAVLRHASSHRQR